MLQLSFGLVFMGQLFSISSVRSATCEAIVPVSTAGKLGEDAILKCRQSSQNIAWTFCPISGKPKVIVSNCEVVPSSVGNYRLDPTANSCNLIIYNVTVSHWGTYTCQDLSLSNPGYSAELGNTSYNVAFGRPAIQSSTFRATAAAAVDGIADGRASKGTCAMINATAPVWWAVDLGQETKVNRVRITSRTECCPDQLQNFYIGLTNVSPWTSPPTLEQGSVCKFFVGRPRAAIRTEIYCEPSTAAGRYLFIMPKTTSFLTICELEAYYN
jgi:hypothetical protein